jgi:hypothetical protein
LGGYKRNFLEEFMATFHVQFETKSSNGTSSGVQGTTVTANSIMEAKNKVKAQHAHSNCRIIYCVKKG